MLSCGYSGYERLDNRLCTPQAGMLSAHLEILQFLPVSAIISLSQSLVYSIFTEGGKASSIITFIISLLTRGSGWSASGAVA